MLNIHFSPTSTNLVGNSTYLLPVYADYQFATNVPLANDSALVLTSSNTNSVPVVGNQLHTKFVPELIR